MLPIKNQIELKIFLIRKSLMNQVFYGLNLN